MKLDKSSLKVISIVFTSFLVPAIVQFVNQNLLNFTFIEDQPIFSFLIYCAFFIVATIFIMGAIELVKIFFLKRDGFDKTNEKIKEECEKFNFPNKDTYVQMFTLPESNDVNHDDEERYRPNKNEMKSNTIYYSFSAKEYLNWIDYIYLNFIRKLKQKLKCKVVIGLHFPDEIKECKIKDGVNTDPNIYNKKFKKICVYFKEIIKSIIGDDVIIKTENEFYKENVKKYAEDFHNVYVSTALYYANLIVGPKDSSEKEFTYKNFKRKLSHIESAFPIWMMSIKNKHSRTYVIDNKFSQELWEMEPLAKIRTRNKINFIEVASLRDPYNDDMNTNRIDVHTEASVPNLSDPSDVLMEKLKNTNLGIKKMMLALLDDNYTNIKDCLIPKVTTEETETENNEFNTKLYNVMTDIAAKYNIKRFGTTNQK